MRLLLVLMLSLCVTAGAEGVDAFGTAAVPLQLKGGPELGGLEKTGQGQWRLTTLQKPRQTWDLQAQAALPQGLQEGATYLLELRLRCISGGGETAEGRSELIVEKNGEPWTKTLEQAVSVGREWKLFQFPFKSSLGTAPGGAQMALRMGYGPQVLELSGLKLRRFDGQSPEQLPRTRASYQGMEANAPWRAAAAARIESLRRSDLKLLVVDKAGKPLPGVAVSLSMRRHRFVLGTALAERLAAPSSPQYNPRYVETALEHFNAFTLENGLKWPYWEEGAGTGSSWFKQAWVDELLAFGAAQRMSVRGHVLVWPSWRNTPPWLRQHEKDPAALRKAVLDHIASLATHTRGRVAAWDVLNEPYTEHDLIDILGAPEMAAWFKAAQAADPKAQLCINEYGIFSSGGQDHAHQDHYDRSIQALLKEGAPLQGIGIQSHLGSQLTDPATLLALLDRFGRFKLPIRITEFDIEQTDQEILGRYIRDYCTVLYSHPAVDGMVLWGHWDPAHWKKNALLYDQDFKLKPAGQAWVDQFYKAWWTQDQGKSDAQGRYQARGYHGDYELELSAQGKVVTQELSLGPGGAELKVVFP